MTTIAELLLAWLGFNAVAALAFWLREKIAGPLNSRFTE